ncbi:MAG: hypothetical protein HG424_002815 [candidate division SR1 bacterium]|nr:hypothetical protein [candidate division SR1 bacterium]
MGVQIRIDGGYQIEKELFFGYTYTHTGLINLSSELGEAMRYNEPEIIIIDYPGEYDVKGRFIKAVLGKNNKLNYLIQGKNKKFGIIQSADVLELDEVGGMDTWLYLGENIEKKFEQLEMEGDLINLETIEKESA